MHTPDQTHKERLYLDINLQLMQKNLPEIKWLIVLLEKEVKKYFKSEKEEIDLWKNVYQSTFRAPCIKKQKSTS